MKIALFSDNFFPELSGITDSIIVLAKNLDKKGHQIEFFAPNYSKKNYQTANLQPEEINLGANIKINRFFSFPYPTSTKQGRMVIPTVWRWLKLKNKNFDVIHTQDFFGAGLEALIAAKLLKIPLIGTNHTPITEFLNYSPIKNMNIKNISRRYVSWYYNKCEYVTAPSKIILDEMKQFGLYKPSQALSNPIDLKNFFPVSSEVKKNLKKEFKLSDYTVLCSGRLAPEKKADVVIKSISIAIKKFPDINLALTGAGSSEQTLKKLSKELKLEKNIKFFGNVSPEILQKLYQASDIYTIASIAETQSISLMKAMSVGLPAIGVNSWALPEYIGNDSGFIVEPGDFKNMAEKIIFLFNNPEKAKLIGQAGILKVKNYSEKNIANIWENIYNNAISNFNKKI